MNAKSPQLPMGAPHRRNPQTSSGPAQTVKEVLQEKTSMLFRQKITRDTSQSDATVQSRSWSRIATAAAVSGGVLVLVGLGATPAAYASSVGAPPCEPSSHTVPGGEARWTKCFGDNWTSVDGWVRDTRKDGKCAEVYTRFANGASHQSSRACPKDDVERFSWKEPGIGVAVYLRTVPAG
jgi:hypothetical protein